MDEATTSLEKMSIFFSSFHSNLHPPFSQKQQQKIKTTTNSDGGCRGEGDDDEETEAS
jgi:hypothetical protein